MRLSLSTDDGTIVDHYDLSGCDPTKALFATHLCLWLAEHMTDGSEPDVDNESPLCGCGEPTCLGQCGYPVMQDAN